MATETIKVTQADVDAANEQRQAQLKEPRLVLYSTANYCPIAQAVRHQHLDWRVAETRILDFNYDTIASLPGTAIAFIQDFDAGKAVEPLEFEIEV